MIPLYELIAVVFSNEQCPLLHTVICRTSEYGSRIGRQSTYDLVHTFAVYYLDILIGLLNSWCPGCRRVSISSSGIISVNQSTGVGEREREVL